MKHRNSAQFQVCDRADLLETIDLLTLSAYQAIGVVWPIWAQLVAALRYHIAIEGEPATPKNPHEILMRHRKHSRYLHGLSGIFTCK